MAFINCDFSWSSITQASDLFNSQLNTVNNLKSSGADVASINSAIDILNNFAHQYNSLVSEYEAHGCGTVNPSVIPDLPHVGQTGPPTTPPPSGPGPVSGTPISLDLSGVVAQLGGIISVLNANLGAIDRDLAAAITQNLSTAILGLYNSLQDFFNVQEDPAQRGIAGLVQTLQAFFLHQVHQAGGAGGDLNATLQDFIRFQEDDRFSGIAGIKADLHDFILFQEDDRFPGTARIANSIASLAGSFNPEKGPFKDLTDALSALGNVFSPLAESPASPGNYLQEILHYIQDKFIKDNLVAHDAANADLITLQRFVGGPFEGKGASILGAFSGLWNLFNVLAGKVFETVAFTAGPLVDKLESPAVELGSRLLMDVQRKLIALGKANPGTAQDSAIEAFETQLGLGTRAHLIAIAGELVPEIKHLGFPQLSAFLVDMAGFRSSARVAMDTNLDAAVQTPAREGARAQFEPTNPDLRLLTEMRLKREIGSEGFTNFLQYLGYDPEWREIIEGTIWREPRIRDLALAMTDVNVDPAWLHTKVLRAGYSDEDVDHIVAGLVQNASKGARAKLVTQATDLFVDGLLDAAGLDAQFDVAGLSDDQRKFELSAAQLRSRLLITRELITSYTESVRNGLITIEDYQVQLTALGMDQAHVNLRVQREAGRLQKALITKEAAATQAAVRKQQALLIPKYLTLYRDGGIDDAGLEAALTALGLSETLASQLVSLEHLTLTITVEERTRRSVLQFTEQVQRKNIAAMTELFRARQIDLTQLQTGLLQLGVSNAFAAAVVAEERARSLKGAAARAPVPEKGLASQLQSQYVGLLKQEFEAGEIDEATLENGLVQVGLDYEIASVVTAREVLKGETKAAGHRKRSGSSTQPAP